MLRRMMPRHTQRSVTEEPEYAESVKPEYTEPVKPDAIHTEPVKSDKVMKSLIHRMMPRRTQRSVTGSYDTVVRIYVLCHTEERFTSAQQIYKPWPWAIPILMKYQDCTFENAFWKQLLEIKDEWASCDMVGTVSYSGYKKKKMAVIDRIIRDRTKWKSGYFNFNDTQKSITNDHPNLLKIINDVMKTIGIPLPTASYFNYWMCTPDKMTRFIDWFETTLKPAVLAHPLVMTNAQYRGSLNKQALMTVCGMPFYPHVPFVIERLNKAFFVNQIDIALVSVFKNEGHILEEWIEHYLKEGVCCFLLTDNGSTDDYLPKIQRYIDQGTVVLRVDPTKHKQIDHLNAFLDKAKQFDWVIGVDLDEFIYARKGYSTIKQYLQSLDKAVGCVSIPWKMFGSNGRIEQPASVLQGFDKRKKNGDERIECKTIVRGDILKKFDIHFHHLHQCKLIASDGITHTPNSPFLRISEDILEKSYLHLNHYAIQSWEFFSTIKMTRGTVAGECADDFRNAAYFKQYDHKDMVDNELAQKCYKIGHIFR